MFTRSGVLAFEAAIRAHCLNSGGDLFVSFPEGDEFEEHFLNVRRSGRRMRSVSVIADRGTAVSGQQGLQVLFHEPSCEAQTWTVIWVSAAGGAAFSVERLGRGGLRPAGATEFRGFVALEAADVNAAWDTGRRALIEHRGVDPGPSPCTTAVASIADSINARVFWELQAGTAAAERRAFEAEKALRSFEGRASYRSA
jgi:hypothetical protein